MIATIKYFLGLGSPTDYTALLKKGAQIVDVRTPIEFGDGHIKGSINIPLDKLQQNLNHNQSQSRDVFLKTTIQHCAPHQKAYLPLSRAKMLRNYFYLFPSLNYNI